MIVLGLDLSMSKTGVAVFKDGLLIHTELIKPKSTLNHGENLKFQYDRFVDLKNNFNPTRIAIEKGFTRFNTSTQVVYRVHGVANMAFSDIEQVYYLPTEVKKRFTGKGNATKDEMVYRAKNEYGVHVSEDEADAIAVGYCLIKELNK